MSYPFNRAEELKDVGMYPAVPKPYGMPAAPARKFNTHILAHITQSEDYPTLKAVCEGRELPAYEAAANLQIPVDGRTPAEIAEEIADRISSER